MSVYKATAKDMQRRFDNAKKQLMKAIHAYDDGEYDEAENMARLIVNLIGDRFNKDGKPSKNFYSITQRLGIKPDLMHDSSIKGVIDRKELHGPVSVLTFSLPGHSGFLPLLDGFEIDQPRERAFVPYEGWWNGIVIRDSRGNEFSRRILIETLRDKVANHTDDEFPEEYWRLHFGNGFSFRHHDSKPMNVFDSNVSRVAIRQIAHELLVSLEPSLQQLHHRLGDGAPMPIVVCAVQRRGADGSFEAILDHKSVELVTQVTSTPEVGSSWFLEQEWVPLTFGRNPAPEREDHDLRVRYCFISFSKYGLPPQFRAQFCAPDRVPEWVHDDAFPKMPPEN